MLSKAARLDELHLLLASADFKKNGCLLAAIFFYMKKERISVHTLGRIHAADRCSCGFHHEGNFD